MIEVNGPAKRYGEFTAVKNLSFTVQPGEVLGLVGPNGAGIEAMGQRLIFTAVVAAAVLVGELAAAGWWLGGRLERFDLSTELPR